MEEYFSDIDDCKTLTKPAITGCMAGYRQIQQKKVTNGMPRMEPDGKDVDLYHANNYIDSDQDSILDGVPYTGTNLQGDFFEHGSPLDFPPVETQSASSAYDIVLVQAGAGATVANTDKRDSVDARIVSEVVGQTGQIVDSPPSPSADAWEQIPPGGVTDVTDNSSYVINGSQSLIVRRTTEVDSGQCRKPFGPVMDIDVQFTGAFLHVNPTEFRLRDSSGVLGPGIYIIGADVKAWNGGTADVIMSGISSTSYDFRMCRATTATGGKKASL